MKIKYAFLWIFLLTVIFCGCTYPKKDSSTGIVHSLKQKEDSIPPQKGNVNDFEDLFSDTEEHTLDSIIQRFEWRTAIQLAIITIDTSMTTVRDFDDFTLKLANEWTGPNKDLDVGIVIGISKGLRYMRIQNSRRIQRVLSDSETKQIVDLDFIESYREAKYFEGTLNGINALIEVLEKRHKIIL